MTYDESDDIGPGNLTLMLSLLAEGKPNVTLSRQALQTFCRIARAQRFPESPFPIEMLDWIATAFEKFLAGGERKIAKSLGLTARGTPVDPETAIRNAAIATRVVQLRAELPDGQLTDNRAGEGIFATVADEFRVSETVVRDIWYAPKMQTVGKFHLELIRRLGLKDERRATARANIPPPGDA